MDWLRIMQLVVCITLLLFAERAYKKKDMFELVWNLGLFIASCIMAF
jgi:hypothetical protein